MKFLSDVGRPWTLSELSTALRLRKLNHEIGYIATLLDRSVEEVRVVLE